MLSFLDKIEERGEYFKILNLSTHFGEIIVLTNEWSQIYVIVI